MKEVEDNVKVISPLVDKLIHIKPVKRKGSWITQLTANENHDGAFMYSGSAVRILGVPHDNNTRKRVDVLTPDEEAFFESKESRLGFEKGKLSIYKEPNYWDSFEMILKGGGTPLNLNDPMDYLRYKFLLAQKDIIAPSWEDRFKKGTYKYAVVDEDIISQERVEQRNKQRDAERFFGKIEDIPEKMIDFLNMYYKGKKAVSENSKRTFLVATIDEIIENDLPGFLKIAQDPHYEIKSFINRCIRRDLIVQESAGVYYIQGEEDRFSLTELVTFLSAKKNQSIYGKLKAQLQ